MAMNKIMVFSGITTLLQAIGQMTFSGLGIAQYYCLIDFLKQLPLLVFLRILYLHNPSTCGTRIVIGQTIDGISNTAFVLVTQEPTTVSRTFALNSVGLFLSVFWLIFSIILLRAGVRSSKSNHSRWPWIVITSLVTIVDVVATVTYANDSFYTQTLTDMMSYIGGTASGMGNTVIDTSLTSWAMVALSSRFVVLFFLNIVLIILVIIDCSKRRKADDAEALVQAQSPMPSNDTISERDAETASYRDDEPPRIPRPGLSHSFRRMKTALFNKLNQKHREMSTTSSSESTPDRSLKHQHTESNKKRMVNFPENLLSLPQRLENLIAEQQKRLDKAVIDTAGRSPPRASQSMPQLDSVLHQPESKTGRKETTAELHRQLPWAYIGSANRMRDQLPPDEELPPVPLPDYTAIHSFRKASVHRAASSLSSLTQKREYMSNQSQRPQNTQSDVLY